MVKKSKSQLERHQPLLLAEGLQSRMHLPVTAVQLLLAKLLAFLCAYQFGVTDIVKRDITTHLSEKI